MEFAVKILNEKAEKGGGYWVLAIDPMTDCLLIAREDNRLVWVNMNECVLLKVATPEVPRPVIAMQPPKPMVLDPRKLNGVN